MSVRPIWSEVQLKSSVSLLVFCLDDLSNAVTEVSDICGFLNVLGWVISGGSSEVILGTEIVQSDLPWLGFYDFPVGK